MSSLLPIAIQVLLIGGHECLCCSLMEWQILPVGVHGDLSAKLLCSYTPNPLPTEPKVQHPQKYVKANSTCRRASNPPVKRPLSRVVRVLDFQDDDLIPFI